MKLYQRNIKLDYVYRFFASFDLKAAIWVLFLMSRGLSLIEIGFLESVYHGTSLLFEVPTGMIADVLGRKKTIVIGRLSYMCACLVMLIATNFWGYALAFFLQAVGGCLNSGSEEALVYDSLKKLEKEDQYLKINSRLNIIIEMAQSLAVFLGGLLAEVSFSLTYVVAFLIGSTTFGLSLCFKEVPGYEHSNQPSFVTHVKQTGSILVKTRALNGMLLFFPFMTTMSTIVYFYAQAYFKDYGYSTTIISIIYLINGLVSALGALCSTTFGRWFKAKTWAIIAIAMSMCMMSLHTSAINLMLIGFYGINFFTAALYPISNQYIHEHSPSEQRATIISCESLCFSLFMIILFPLGGLLGEQIGLVYSFRVMGLLGLISTLLMIKKKTLG